MSTLDSRLNTSLPGGLDALDRHGLDRQALDRQALDRQGQFDGRIGDPAFNGLEIADPARGPTVDDGEAVLNAPAWDGEDRLLAGGDLQARLARLAGSELGEAVEQGVEDVLAGLG
jgi:hypothetical protein